jgi:hypothetical protein
MTAVRHISPERFVKILANVFFLKNAKFYLEIIVKTWYAVFMTEIAARN